MGRPRLTVWFRSKNQVALSNNLTFATYLENQDRNFQEIYHTDLSDEEIDNVKLLKDTELFYVEDDGKVVGVFKDYGKYLKFANDLYRKGKSVSIFNTIASSSK